MHSERGQNTITIDRRPFLPNMPYLLTVHVCTRYLTRATSLCTLAVSRRPFLSSLVRTKRKRMSHWGCTRAKSIHYYSLSPKFRWKATSTHMRAKLVYVQQCLSYSHVPCIIHINALNDEMYRFWNDVCGKSLPKILQLLIPRIVSIQNLD